MKYRIMTPSVIINQRTPDETAPEYYVNPVIWRASASRVCRSKHIMEFLIFMVPYILEKYIFCIKSPTRCTLSRMYSLFHYICSTCFGCCYTHHQELKLQSTAIGMRSLLWCEGSWKIHWSRLQLGHPHTFSTVKLAVLSFPTSFTP
jgi:hypothetical protein